jgi:predicted dinucleotide-binding enzyme
MSRLTLSLGPTCPLEEDDMKIGVLGTGMVGSAIATKLVELGHDVKMGAREPHNERASTWVEATGAGATHGTFADAADHGEMVFNCTSGMASVDALQAAGASSLAGKILVDVANPLDFSHGMPPSLGISGRDSLGERIQREFPLAKVVKTLNTVNASVMVDAARVPGDHDMFVCGNDDEAKAEVRRLLIEGFGWRTVHDLGDISAARGTEAYVLFWVRLWGSLGTADFNVHVVRRE